MTSPVDQEDLKQPKATSFMDWFHVNQRWVTIGAVAVVIAAGVAWYIPRSRQMKNEAADKQLLAAKQSLQSGNSQLAESDLKKVADRYAGTAAGTEAGVTLAQLKMERGDAAGAVTYLQQLAGQVGTSAAAAGVHGLLGDAYLQVNKPAEAAAEYDKGTGLTEMENEKAILMSKAAQAYVLAGKPDAAKKLYQALAAKSDLAVAAEARVRLGELEVGGGKS